LREKLDYLKDLGVTAIELMPLSDFAGNRGWGYDGVLPYAPDSAYGRPSDLKKLIDSAHAKGLMVLLDVVYNHFGPSGNCLPLYAGHFFNPDDQTPWGDAINMHDPHVRRFFIENALYWLEEYRFDGLRFDAVHAILDRSDKHFLTELAETVHASLPSERQVHLVLENDANQAQLLERDAHGTPRLFTAQWDDDLHHALHVLLTGETGGYYEDYREETVERLGRCLTEGFDYQGEPSRHRKNTPRGEKSGHLPPQAFVAFLQNHDQIGNRAMGERLGHLISEERLHFALSMLLLLPQAPMLFMGEEWNASAPFLYFCHFDGELANAVREGRRREFASFAEFNDPERREKIPDPTARATFQQSKLDWCEIEEKADCRETLEGVRRLLALRAQSILPLLRSGMVSAHHSAVQESGLQVRWRFKSGSLHLSANFSDHALAMRALPGEVIWGENAAMRAPWHCVWSIARE
jgi:maltooligosyltrehalose trehalohydrolase